MKTGDLLLFTSDCWYSKVIEVGTDSKYSHCGVILVDPIGIDPSLTGTYLLESGREPFLDAVDHQFHFGVEIVPLGKVLEEYVQKGLGQIYHRSLQTTNMIPDLHELYEKIRNKPYNCNVLDWIEAWTGVQWFDKQMTNKFWCSALATFIYTQIGVLDPSTPWSLITPKDLSEESTYPLKWINSSLGKEVCLL